MAKQVLHIEFHNTKPGENAKWYANLFGWDVQEWPQYNYSTVRWADNPSGGAGFGEAGDEFPAGTIIIYIESDDVQADLERVIAAGATLVAPPMDLPGVGTMGFFRDPEGTVTGLLKPEPMPAA